MINTKSKLTDFISKESKILSDQVYQFWKKFLSYIEPFFKTKQDGPRFEGLAIIEDILSSDVVAANNRLINDISKYFYNTFRILRLNTKVGAVIYPQEYYSLCETVVNNYMQNPRPSYLSITKSALCGYWLIGDEAHSHLS